MTAGNFSNGEKQCEFRGGNPVNFDAALLGPE